MTSSMSFLHSRRHFHKLMSDEFEIPGDGALDDYIDARRAVIDERLLATADAVEPDVLAGPMRHALLSGGKRVRPTLTILCCEAVGGTIEDALEFAVAIELVHTASLVVDDIIDRAALRRGTESTWVSYDHDGAIIGSNGLIAEALERFAREPLALEIATNALVELGEGEATELVDEPLTQAAYIELARRKTGVLFSAAAEVGVIAGNGDPSIQAALGTYAERVGVAFQIRDDVLDVIADVETLGKPSGRDAAMERPSLLALSEMDPEAADTFAKEQSQIAIDALDDIPDLDQTLREYLEALAMFVVTRDR